MSHNYTDLGDSVQHAGGLGHPVVNLSSSSAGVNVSQERRHYREVCGEAVIYVLLLHW